MTHLFPMGKGIKKVVLTGLIFLVTSMFWNVTMAGCGDLGILAEKNGVYIPGDDAGRRVIGEGRLQFYTAPDERCEMRGIFIVPEDTVSAYYEYRNYTEISYFNLKTGASASGWVKSERLKPDGLGIAPHQP